MCYLIHAEGQIHLLEAILFGSVENIDIYAEYDSALAPASCIPQTIITESPVIVQAVQMTKNLALATAIMSMKRLDFVWTACIYITLFWLIRSIVHPILIWQ